MFRNQLSRLHSSLSIQNVLFKLFIYFVAIVGKPKLNETSKPKVEERYIPPQWDSSCIITNRFAEVDPEEKKQERLTKFFQNEVVGEVNVVLF